MAKHPRGSNKPAGGGQPYTPTSGEMRPPIAQQRPPRAPSSKPKTDKPATIGYNGDRVIEELYRVP
jgi:hypothetical protein